MKTLTVLSMLALIILSSHSIRAQQLRFSQGAISEEYATNIQQVVPDPLPAGVYTIGGAGDFPTIDSAFTKLSLDGIFGSVVFELIDTFYTAPTTSRGFLLNGPIQGADQNNPVYIFETDHLIY